VSVRVDRSSFRQRHTYLAALTTELAAPLLRQWARHLAVAPAKPPSAWRRAVLLSSTHIGDILYRSASLPHFKHALPECRLTYLCSPLTRDLLETHPAVDDVLAIAETGADWRRAAVSVLRAGAFDVALCTDHIAYQHDLLLATRAGIPSRVGFAHKGFSALVTHPVAPPANVPYAGYTRALIASVGELTPTWDLTPVLVTTPDDERQADAVWRALELGAAPTTIACTMTLRQETTATWPPEAFIAALEHVARAINLEVVLCGSAADAPVLRAAAALARFPCRVAAGALGLRALGALFRRCRLLLAMDSGPRHIANAVGTPVVFVRSLKAIRIEAGVYCANETDVAPDEERLTLDAQRAALARLQPDAVAAVILERLAPLHQPYETSPAGGTSVAESNRRSPVT